jgi:hypothetical protein
MTVGILIHEIAHAYDAIILKKDKNDKWHTKKMMNVVRFMNEYCKNREYFKLGKVELPYAVEMIEMKGMQLPEAVK